MATSNFDIVSRLYTKITETEPTEALSFLVPELRDMGETHITETEALCILTANDKPAFLTDNEWSMIMGKVALGADHEHGRSARSIVADIMTEELRSFDGKYEALVAGDHLLNITCSADDNTGKFITYAGLHNHALLSNRDIVGLIATAVEAELEAVCGRTMQGYTPWIKDISSAGHWTINVGRDDLMMTVFKDGAFVAELLPITLCEAIYKDAQRDLLLDAARGLKAHLDSGWIMQQVQDCLADNALPAYVTWINGETGHTMSSVEAELKAESGATSLHISEINERLILEAGYALKIAARRLANATRVFGDYTVSDVTIYGQQVQCRINGIMTGDLDVTDLVETFIYHRLSLYQEGSDALGSVAEEITANTDWSQVADLLCCAILYTVAFNKNTMFKEQFELDIAKRPEDETPVAEKVDVQVTLMVDGQTETLWTQVDREQYEREFDAVETEYTRHALLEEDEAMAAEEAFIAAFPYGRPEDEIMKQLEANTNDEIDF